MEPRPEFDQVDFVCTFMMGHDLWPRAECLASLKLIGEAFPRATDLIICDTYRSDLPSTERHPVFTLGFETAHAVMGQMIPSLDEWTDVLAEAGWLRTDVIDFDLPVHGAHAPDPRGDGRMNAPAAAGRHILVLNRFDQGVGCDYTAYIDHTTDRVAYLVPPAGISGVDAGTAETVVVVDDLADWLAVSERACDIVRRFGPVDHVVALFERDLETAAALRELLGVSGPRPEDIARVRDKVPMKQLVASAGLRVPRFVEAREPEQVRRLAAECGFPVVLKPRDGSGSQGIYLINSPGSLEETLALPLENYVCEEFVSGTMYQVDGVIQDGTVRVLRAFRLLNTCLDYALGDSFGSVAADDPELERRLTGYSEVVLSALGVRSSVFHLEVFTVDPTGPGEYDGLVFLEVAARAAARNFRTSGVTCTGSTCWRSPPGWHSTSPRYWPRTAPRVRPAAISSSRSRRCGPAAYCRPPRSSTGCPRCMRRSCPRRARS